MARPLLDSEYIFGLHEPGGESHMLEAGKPGWVLFTEAVGHDPEDPGGTDFSRFSNQNLGVICRINNGYEPQGTIPHSSHYADFAQRCANFVANSHGCKIWIIGNEMNFKVERPQVAPAALSAARPDRAGSPPPAATTESAPIADPPHESQSTPTDRPPSLWHTLTRWLLRQISAGMGDAELGDGAEHTAGAHEEAHPLPYEDPFGHGHPDRFSALRSGEASLESASVGSDLVERAIQDGREVITPQLYARCYALCRAAIHAVPGHADDQVLIGAVAPWNDNTKYGENPAGDWIRYFSDILELLGADGCDGITIHTYTHNWDPNLIRSEVRMDAPFSNYHFEFRTYRDFMNAIPVTMRHLPVYITETDQDVAWEDRNTGWVQQAYGEIDAWNNTQGNQQIRAMILYRWPRVHNDRWFIEGKRGVIDDFRSALQFAYTWKLRQPPKADFEQGMRVVTTDIVNLRRSPGYLNKPINDVVAEIPAGAEVTVVSGSSRIDDRLIWWQVEHASGSQIRKGWLAQFSPTGIPLLRKKSTTDPTITPPQPIEPGDTLRVGYNARTLDIVRMRRTLGYRNKDASDIITDVPEGAVLAIVAGPQRRDELDWFKLRGTVANRQIEGWMAASVNGIELLAPTGERTDAPPDGDENGLNEESQTSFEAGEYARTLNIVRMRRTPGFAGKPEADVVRDVPLGVVVQILGGPQALDGLTWWEAITIEQPPARGWMAEADPTGATLLAGTTAPSPTGPTPTGPTPAGPTPTDPLQEASFAVGELIVAAEHVRVRRSPGYLGKSADDVLGDFIATTTLNVLEGPRRQDNLAWWRVGGISLSQGEVIGWVAGTAPGGTVLLSKPPQLPGINIPDHRNAAYLHAPFRGNFGISQLWGERPHIYSRYTYDGVALLGHNGVDFLTPTGTELLAVHDGTVLQAELNDPSGLGNFILLRHSWGESIYAHMQAHDVRQGQEVRRGQRIGWSNDSGFSNGPHLHFAIRIHPYTRADGWGGYSDPLPYMNPADVQLPAYVLASLPRAFSVLPEASAPTQEAAAMPAQNRATGIGLAPDQAGLRRP